MRRFQITLAALVIAIPFAGACGRKTTSNLELTPVSQVAETDPAEETEALPEVDPEISQELLDLISYRTGYGVGLTWAQQELAPDIEQVVRGIEDGMAGNDQPRPPLEMDEAYSLFMQKIAARRKTWAPRNLEASREFLAANAGREGVVTLPSGLQYEVLVEGEGASPTLDDRVTVHYRAWRIDGREIQSSHYRGQPAVFTLQGTIEGWKEGIPLMTEGAMWKFYLPPDLAYGEAGYKGFIQPNDALIYEVELIGFEPIAATAQGS